MAAISRRAISARTSGWARSRARWTWRSACPAATVGDGGTAGRPAARARALAVAAASASVDAGHSVSRPRCWRRRGASGEAAFYLPAQAPDARHRGAVPAVPRSRQPTRSRRSGRPRSWRRAWPSSAGGCGRIPAAPATWWTSCWRRRSGAAASSPSKRWPSPGIRALQIFRGGARRPGPRSDAALLCRGAAHARGRFPRGHGRRVPDHRHRGGPGEGTREHRRALRHRRARARMPGASRRSGTWRMRWRRGALAGASPNGRAVTDLRSRAALSRLRRGHHGRPGRNGLLPAPAHHGPRCLDGDDRRRAHPGLERPPRCRRSATPTATASRTSTSPSPSGLPNRLYRARGDGTFEDATERAGLAVLDDTSQVLFADVDNDGDQDLVLSLSAGPALFLNDGTGRFTRVPDAFHFDRATPGLAHVDGDGRLRPRRLPRSLPVRLFVLLRRGRGQGGHAHALLRRPQRPARACCSATTATVTSSRPPTTPASTSGTTATTSPRPGPITTATAGPTSWWRTTSAGRTCTTTGDGATGR